MSKIFLTFILIMFICSCNDMEVKTIKVTRNKYEVSVSYTGYINQHGNDTKKTFEAKARKLCPEEYYTHFIHFKRSGTKEEYKGLVICR